MGDTWWDIIICPCVNVFSLTGGVTESDVGFPTDLYKKTAAFKITMFLLQVITTRNHIMKKQFLHHKNKLMIL